MAVIFPTTARFVNVPTLVIFGCALVINVPLRYVADNKLAPVSCDETPLNVMLPFDTKVSPVMAPTLVIFG